VPPPSDTLTLRNYRLSGKTGAARSYYGRIFNDIEEVRVAVRTFTETYNELCRIEKLGFLSPRMDRM
jgi:hypothetical protein